MTEPSFREQLRQRLERDRLEESQYRELERMMSDAPDTATAKKGLSRRSFLTGLATAAGLAAVGIGAWNMQQSGPLGPETLSAEVLRNHQWLKPLDLTTQRFEQLAGYFTEGLDFELVPSQRIIDEGLTLEGGRYCSLGGIKAAQIVFRNAEGEMVTHYQTRYDPEAVKPVPRVDESETPIVMIRDEHRITIWRERGILMATAQRV